MFNPTTQGAKFDPDGSYVRRWVPELADVATKHVTSRAPAPTASRTGTPRRSSTTRRSGVEALDRYERIKR